jgi:predicted alpha/beta-hydrolase family hydrolase
MVGRSATTTVVLGHGAGGGVESPDLQAVTAALVEGGVRVALVEQPWRVAARKVASRPAVLDAAWVEVIAALRLGSFVAGGRSAGARVACRTARQTGALGVVALAFPLHPPGRAESTRMEELLGAGVPVLAVQGDRDPFGTASEVRAAAPQVTVLGVEGGDHALARAGVAAAGLEGALAGVVAFVRGLSG